MTDANHYPEPTLFDMLSNYRRRITVVYLALFEPAATVEVRHLARVIRAIETGMRPGQIGSADYESAYNGLIQTHLPALQRADAIAYDDASKTVATTDATAWYAVMALLGQCWR